MSKPEGVEGIDYICRNSSDEDVLSFLAECMKDVSKKYVITEKGLEFLREREAD
jgi:hypothetical protein